MSTEVSPLRQRMIEDMNARKLGTGTQRGHIHSCKRFAGFLKRSPDTATPDDIRRFQLHLAEAGLSIPTPRKSFEPAAQCPHCSAGLANTIFALALPDSPASCAQKKSRSEERLSHPCNSTWPTGRSSRSSFPSSPVACVCCRR